METIIRYSYIKGLKIICDTNVLIDLNQDHLERKLWKFLAALTINGNTLHHSQYTVFELFRGQPKKVVDDYQGILESFEAEAVLESALITAAQLMTLYKHHHIISDASTSRKNPLKIDDGDYIIAASAFLNENSAILTRNYSDFPRPFFNEVAKYFLEYKKDGKKSVEVYYVLAPDTDYANKVYDFTH